MGGSVAAPAATRESRGFLSEAVVNRASLFELKQLVRRQVPDGALVVEQSLDHVRVRGPVFNVREKLSLATRIAPALARVDITEVRVDPWALANHLERRLREDGAENVQVVPYVTASEQILFVLFRRTDDFDEVRVRRIAGRYVLDQEVVYVQPDVTTDDAAPTQDSSQQ